MSKLKAIAGLVAFVVSDVLVGAQESLNNTSVLGGQPSCAQPCTMVWQTANCSLSDENQLAECICNSIPLQSAFSICIQSACTSLDDQKDAFGIENGVCEGYPKEMRGNAATIAAIVTIALSVPVVVGRCAARLKITKKLWLDDYMTIFTLILLLAMATMQLVSVQKGIGTHYWNLDLDNLSIIRLFFYISKILYVIVQCTGKLAILLLYQKVFDTGNGAQWFQRAIKIMIVLTFIIEGVFVLLIALQCQPVAALWDPTIQDAKCFNGTIAFSVGGILNISSDLVLMILPIPALRKLQVSAKKRAGIVLVLAIASLGIVASLVRIRYIVAGSSAFDSTFYNVDVFSWSLIELLCVVVCGSIPALRPLLVISLSTITSSLSSTRQKSERAANQSRKSVIGSYSRHSLMPQRQGSASYPMSPLTPTDPASEWKKAVDDPPISYHVAVHARSLSAKDIQTAYITNSSRHSASGSEDDLVSSIKR